LILRRSSRVPRTSIGLGFRIPAFLI
jgi:hypothetical protein